MELAKRSSSGHRCPGRILNFFQIDLLKTLMLYYSYYYYLMGILHLLIFRYQRQMVCINVNLSGFDIVIAIDGLFMKKYLREKAKKCSNVLATSGLISSS